MPDYNHVFGPIWQGGVQHDSLNQFDVLVLTANDVQEPPPGFQGKTLYFPFKDSPELMNLFVAQRAAKAVLRYLAAHPNAKVLITCYMGWNRSGLVTALILRGLGISAPQAILLVRGARGPNALTNLTFANWAARDGIMPSPTRSSLS